MNKENLSKHFCALSDLSLGMSTKLYMNNLFKNKTLVEVQGMDSMSEWKKSVKNKYLEMDDNTKIYSYIGFSSTFDKVKNLKLKELSLTTTNQIDDENIFDL